MQWMQTMKPLTFCLFLSISLNGFSQPYSESWKDLNHAGDSEAYPHPGSLPAC